MYDENILCNYRFNVQIPVKWSACSNLYHHPAPVEISQSKISVSLEPTILVSSGNYIRRLIKCAAIIIIYGFADIIV
ncbi:MAG: hypothetical protein Q4C65_08680, partial [Eubacteriales bacterium]|nr:hypothetical protein [Eubacteriales bacterium]